VKAGSLIALHLCHKMYQYNNQKCAKYFFPAAVAGSRSYCEIYQLTDIPNCFQTLSNPECFLIIVMFNSILFTL
jgi:hypothetical protein